MGNPIVGIVPAAGKGTRLRRSVCSKELVSIGETTSSDGSKRPKAMSEYLVEAMIGAGAERICMVIAPDKQDLVRFYGGGDAIGAPIAYICQEMPTGMADAVDRAYPWLTGATVLMGMPDTVFRPADALSRLRAFYERVPTDVALAIAPTDEPGRLGPVIVEPNGRVLEVLDKPEVPPHNKVWVVACWGPAFTEFLHAHLAERRPCSGEVPLGGIFQSAIERGLRVRALTFDHGIYIDAGTEEGLRAARHLIAGGAMTEAPR